MRYYVFQYSYSVKCSDGIVRTIDREGEFNSMSYFIECLEKWDGKQGPAGEPYTYFITGKQAKANADAVISGPHIYLKPPQ